MAALPLRQPVRQRGQLTTDCDRLRVAKTLKNSHFRIQTHWDRRNAESLKIADHKLESCFYILL